MSEPRTVYVVTSGCYSDYSVSCIFEVLEDAKAYLLKTRGAVSLHHDEWVGHRPDDEPDMWDDRIEEFQFWPAGVVPHADA